MKKTTIKAFTLVEMLIVIVIIGILIAALLPRMSAAQGRARDVARKTALSQLQSAIVTYQWDKWEWPQVSSAKNWMDISTDTASGIGKDLINGWMSGIPSDPLATTKFKWLGDHEVTSWHYGYIVTKRNGTDDAGFVLMAKTEVEWGSNRVVCSTAADLTGGKISNDTDIKDVHICSSVKQGTCSAADCTYGDDSELRYIVVY